MKGHKHFSGFEEVVLKNINACKEISAKIKRSFGPYGTPYFGFKVTGVDIDLLGVTRGEQCSWSF
jgi:hypothetical protein